MTSTVSRRPSSSRASRGPTEHPNGALALDHVVITTPDFDRTAAALEAHGMPLRRIREVGDVAGTGFRQGFRRLGPGILELVEARQMPPGPARFWGLVVILKDLGWLASQLEAGWVGEPKDAVQPGRQIATVSALRARTAGRVHDARTGLNAAGPPGRRQTSAGIASPERTSGVHRRGVAVECESSPRGRACAPDLGPEPP